MKLSRSALIKAGVAIVILGGGVTAMLLLSSSKAEANKIEVEAPVRKVDTITPVFGDIPYMVTGNGLVESAGSLQIHSTTSGKVTFSMNNLISGTAVSKDDILLKIDSRQAENTLNLARAELIKAVASIVPQFKSSHDDLYNKWNNYLDTLSFQRDTTPEIPEISNSREKLLISTYGIFATYYNVKNAEILLEQYTVTAPFDGYISGSAIIRGSFISAGQFLFTLIDVENLKVSVPLTIDDLNKIDIGAQPDVEIHQSIGKGTKLKGKLISRDMVMNHDSQMVNIYVEFSNPSIDSRFAPGNYVDLIIEGRTLSDTAALPRYALIDNSFVYTYRDKLLGKEEVSISAVTDDTVYIDNTLPPGTVIVTTILQKPLIGMKLSTIEDAEEMTDEKDS